MAQIIRAGGKALAGNAHGLDRGHRGKNAGKIRVQCATGVGKVSAMTTMIMSLSLIAVILRVLMMGVRNRRRNRLRVGARRRHDARKLGHPEQSDQ
jgi:hypothetical protein